MVYYTYLFVLLFVRCV